MRIRVMLDTNVVLSGLFFSGQERALLGLALRRRIRLVLPEKVLEETRNVIRDKFAGDPKRQEALGLLDLVVSTAEVVTPAQSYAHLKEAEEAIRHENDAPILAAAMATKPAFFITGDKDFFNLKKPVPVRIISCGEFLGLGPF